MKNHTDQKYVITGASRGIGAGIAKHLAEQGAQLALTYASRRETAENLLKELPGQGHFIVQMDLSDEKSIQSAFQTISESFSTLDGLVNNAGITQDQILLRMKTQEFDQVINANLRGTFLCVKQVLKPMMKAKKGSIVNITSVIGQRGNAGQANYAASKARVEALSRSVAQEMAPRNIRVNCVAPGFIVTEMTNALDDNVKKEIIDQVPLNRMGQVEDVAEAVSFLLSENASYITGHTLNVNGGLLMQ